MTSLSRFIAPALASAVLVCASARPTDAQINCGTPSVSHSMRQTPNFQRSVDVVSVTSRPVNNCPLAVETEAWVDALTTSFVNRAGPDAYTASVSFTRPVPSFGYWHSTAKHWLIFMLSGTWQNLGNTYGTALVAQGTYTCSLTSSDCAEGYEFKPSLCACVASSPILIDSAGDGFRLSSADGGVVFDIDANGITAEKIAWTEAESDDGWLVMDRDGNGRIDSGGELFGSRTPAYADTAEPITENGFDALKLLEGPSYGPGKPDRVIDARDAVYSRLRIWFDRNHNGVSEPEELVSLPGAGILALSTEYKENARRDQYGNKFSLMGKALFRGPEGQEIWRNVYDVYLTVVGPSMR
jgi:hypothetical protein